MASHRPKRVKNPNVGSSSGGRRPQPPRLDLERFNVFCKNRPVLRSHVLSVDIPGMDLMDLFRFQHWEPLVTCTDIAYPKAVKMFYYTANFSLGETKTVDAIVQGRGVNLTASHINRFLGVPDDGDQYYHTYLWNHPDIDHNTVLTYLFGSPISGRASNLQTLQMRALHKFISYTILPRGGHFDEVNRMHQYLLYMLLTKRQVNFGYLMINYMSIIPTDKRRSFPYGDFLSKLFTEHFTIIADTNDIFLHNHTHIFNKTTIALMGFKWNEERNEWVPRTSKRPAPASRAEPLIGDEDMEPGDGEEGGQPEMETDYPQVGEGSSSFNIQDELASIREHQARQDDHLVYLRGAVDANTASLGRIEGSMEQMMEWMRAMRFPPQPPSND